MSKPPFEKSLSSIRRKSLSSSIMEMITDSVMSGELKPGDRLPRETGFAQRLGVSRNSLREAIKMLSSIGVVEIRRGLGTYISESMSTSMLNPLVLSLVFEQKSPRDLIQLRLLLDTRAAELALDRLDGQSILALEEANRKLEAEARVKDHDPHRFRDLDLGFHLTLLGLSGNRLLVKIGQAIYKLFFTSIEQTVEHDPLRAFENHRLVIEALKAGDVESVRGRIRESLSFWIQSVSTSGSSPPKEPSEADMHRSDFSKEEMLPTGREPISEMILEKITDYLIAGRLKPGDKLPTENEFAAILGVGRNSIREAMRMLASLGMIEIKRGSGTFIRESMLESTLSPLMLSLVFQQGTSAELADLRFIIETFAAELVIENAGDEDVGRLEAANEKLLEAAEKGLTDSHLLRDLDIHFHYTLFELTKNALFSRIAKTVYRLFFTSLERVIELDLANSYYNHQKYLTGIKQRDVQLARKMISEGLGFWKGYVLK